MLSDELVCGFDADVFQVGDVVITTEAAKDFEHVISP
jgi:hypothetical protein